MVAVVTNIEGPWMAGGLAPVPNLLRDVPGGCQPV